MHHYTQLQFAVEDAVAGESPSGLRPVEWQCHFCRMQLSTDEVRRGFGAFHDPTCQVRGGSWAVYTFPGIPGGAPQSCCRTCRWNKDDAVAAWLQPTELDDCPPCVRVGARCDRVEQQLSLLRRPCSALACSSRFTRPHASQCCFS
jgi:hypothetical protein